MKKIFVILIIVSFVMVGINAIAMIDCKKGTNYNILDDEDTEYWALIVGCNEFMNRPQSALPNNDLAAEDLYYTLLKSDHWQPDQIKLLTGKEATTLNIIMGLRWLDKMDDEDDICLFYIATHGGPLPVDFPPYDEDDGCDEALSTYSTWRIYLPRLRLSICIPWLSFLYDDEIDLLLSMLDAKGVCAIIDSCYSGGFDDISYGAKIDNKAKREPLQISSSRWMQDFGKDLSSSGRVVLMASEEDTLSQTWIFAHYLMEGLQGFANDDFDGMCSAEEAFNYASPKTSDFLLKEYNFPNLPQIFDDYPGELKLTDIDYPPSQPDFVGPFDCNVNKEYSYLISSTDPEGDRIRYFVDWGDGTEEWTDLHESDENVEISHSWNAIGTYNIWFESEDENGIKKYMPPLLKRKVVSISFDCEIDQRQTEIFEGQSFNDGLMTNDIWFAQSFISNKSKLTKVDLETMVSMVYSKEPGPLHLSIRKNLTGEDLTEIYKMPHQVNEHSPARVQWWTTYDFPDIVIEPEQTYYIICRFDNDSIGGWLYASKYYEDPYPEGEAFVSINKGVTWIKSNNINDFCFVTYTES